MFSLQKLFGQEDRFFSMLIASAKEDQKCAQTLKQVLANPQDLVPVSAIRGYRKANKEISEKISELVVSTFVTALEREDIEALASALYSISKPIEKFVARFVMAHRLVPDMNFEPQSRLVERAVEIVVQMVEEMKKGNNLEFVRSLNAQLQQVEHDADDLENNLLQELFTTRSNSLRIIVIKDLYELLEKAIDRCRDAGNVVTHIVLKNS